MHALAAPLSLLAWISLWAGARASYIAADLSFGNRRTLSRDRQSIAGFHLVGDPHPPEILSNKIILTPPAPGNQRGAVWADKPLQHTEWTTNVDFRTTGPERGSGNFQIWYTKNGREDASTASIYTAKKFDGLALVIDQYAGSAGYIRGFLNDGSIDYQSHHSVDSLAFGHCEYAYRNLGRPSRLSIKHTNEIFRVDIDGRLCFESNKIKLPVGYFFGMSAASSDNPDSFEVFKFIVNTESLEPEMQTPGQFNDQQRLVQAEQAEDGPTNHAAEGDIPTFSDPPEVQASSIRDAEAQFADLHNRLQAMMRHILAINRDLTASQQSIKDRLNGIENKLARLEKLDRLDAISGIDNRISSISNDVRQTKNDLHTALDRQISGLRSAVSAQHNSVLGAVASSAPRIGMYILVVVGSQLLLVVCYVLYKRRRNGSYKKYL
ncbi:concanavalin A-like lectin/glucanase domain-containing protein [Xylogone sp. PMI_703]|nr:concanavalin A-like lectin/glucanase domain-containing protein [Xylogone sp. PMI_703]